MSKRPFIMPDLLAGDLLIYTGHGLVDLMISTKTWSKACHTEIYVGGGYSVASRNFVGINRYPLRSRGLCRVMRPKGNFNVLSALQRFYSGWQGQRYALMDVVLGFYFATWHADPKRQFCSEFATNFYRAGGFEPFQPDLSADRVAPATFLASNPFEIIWRF